MSSQLVELLSAIYGEDAAAAQSQRYREAVARFREAFGPGSVRVFRAPGRVNLIGEHTDYNHGFVMPVALDRDTLVVARGRSDANVHLVNAEPDFEPVTFTLSEAIPPAPPGHWSNYARGVGQRLWREAGRPLVGMDALVDSRPPYGVPRGAGLSSSSALSVSLALALTAVNELDFPRPHLARLCQEAEWYTGARGGIMDQFNALLARAGHALFLDTRPRPDGTYRFEYAPLPEEYRLLIANSGVHHENARGEYNVRVMECQAGVALLKQHFPHITHLRDVQEVPWEELERLLPEETTLNELAARGLKLEPLPGVDPTRPLKVRRRVRHVWTENHRVLAALEAMRQGNFPELGRLMNEAHASARDDYEVSCPELEVLVEAAREVDGVLGARLTGAGWGGSIVVLVHREATDAAAAHIRRQFAAAFSREPEVFVCRALGAGGEVPFPE